jgi:hypothetical protein
MNVFEGIEHVSAEGTSNRLYFEPGRYVVEIDTVHVKEKRLGGKLFIVETTIKESDNPNIKPGDRRNWVQSLSNEYALPRIKSFLGAAKGFCPKKQLAEVNKNITKSVCDHAVSIENPLKGRILSVECLGKITKTGKAFTHANWGIVDG